MFLRLEPFFISHKHLDLACGAPLVNFIYVSCVPSCMILIYDINPSRLFSQSDRLGNSQAHKPWKIHRSWRSRPLPLSVSHLQSSSDHGRKELNAVIEMHTIAVILPGTDSNQTLVQATSSETVNDIRQSLSDLPSASEYSCFRLQYNGLILNDFVELSSLEPLPERPEFKLVPAPYTERESRIHLARFLDFLNGGMVPSDGGRTNFNNLQLSVSAPNPIESYDHDKPIIVDEVVAHDSFTVPQCLRSLSLSAWNPVPSVWKQRGHLLYLNVITLEGESIHITSSVSGFFANGSTSTTFSPSPSPTTQKFHSLLPLIKSLSILFEKKYTKLEHYMNNRDPILTVPASSAQTVQPWIVKPRAHLPDALRVQKAHLQQDFENNDSLRDWNEELQQTRECPVKPLPERIMRSRLLQKTLYDFSVTATRGAELLVKGELVSSNPSEEKNAQMFMYSNIFFSRGLDGVGTFIREGGDAAAHKAVALDVNGVRILSTLDVEGLCTLGTCIIDLAGQRIVAQSIVPGIFRQPPENESHIIYGGVDGRDIVATDAKCDELFSKVSSALRLRRHAVFEKINDERKELELSIETKGLVGNDGRNYILDLYRLCPVDIEFLDSECVAANEKEFVSAAQSQADLRDIDDGKYPHRMVTFRYELLESYWEFKLNEYAKNKMALEDAAKAEEQTDPIALQTTKAESDRASDVVAITNGVDGGDAASSKNTTDDTPADTAENVVANHDASAEMQSKELSTNGSIEAETKDPKERRVDISDFELLFNPDTFHARHPDDLSPEDLKQKELDEAQVRDVSSYLHRTVIPKFVEDLKATSIPFPIDSDALSKALHERGINLRYLGRILDFVQAEGHTAKVSALVIVAQRTIVSRSIKHVLASLSRDVSFPVVPSLISHFLNCFFSQNNESAIVSSELETLFPDDLGFKSLTRDAVLDLVKREAHRRFRYHLPGDFSVLLSGLPLLREVCRQFGIQLLARDYFAPAQHSVDSTSDIAEHHEPVHKKKSKKGKKSSNNVTNGATMHRNTMFIPDDICDIMPIIKESTPRSGLAEEALEAGRVSIIQGQKDLGMELLMESLVLHEQIYGVLHPEAARGYNALGLIHSSLENKANAVENARKAVIVAERTIGLDSAETILFYINLALFEHANGNTLQALSYLRHALTMSRAVFGGDHPDMITTINNIAVMLQSQDKFADSLKWFEVCAKICEANYGTQSVHYATLSFQIAQALALTGQSKASIARMRQAHEIFERELGPEHNNTKETRMWVTTLTQNAVYLAKQAKLKAASNGLGAQQQNKSGINALTQKLSSNQPVQTAQPLTNTAASGMGTKELDELVKYITGGDSPAHGTGKKVKKTQAKA